MKPRPDKLDLESAQRMAPELAAIVMAELMGVKPSTVKRQYGKPESPFWTELALWCLEAGRQWQAKITGDVLKKVNKKR